MHEKRRFGTRFRETVITNTLLTQNHAKVILDQKYPKIQANPILTQNVLRRILHEKRRFGTRFRETVITNTLLTQNHAKVILDQKYPKIQANPILTQNDVTRISHQNRRFGTGCRETVITYPVLTQNDAKRIFTKNVVLALDLEKQL